MNILIGHLFYQFKINGYLQQNQRLLKNLRSKYRLLITPTATFFLTFSICAIPISITSIFILNFAILIIYSNFIILKQVFFLKN